MTAKEYLSQAFYLNRRIETKQRQLERLKALTTKATSTLSDMPKSKNMEKSPMEKILVKALDLESEIAKDLDELIDVTRKIREVISQVGRIDYETILEMRYLDFMKWEDIAAEMNLSQDYVYQIHRKALRLVHID